MAYADIDDLTARFGRPLTPTEVTQAAVLLDDATFMLATKVPGLDDAVESGDVVITQAAMITTAVMVKRALLAQAAQQTAQPSVEQVSQQFGPYSTSVKYRSDSGELYLYNSEYETLLGLVRGDTSAAVSMRSVGL